MADFCMRIWIQVLSVDICQHTNHIEILFRLFVFKIRGKRGKHYFRCTIAVAPNAYLKNIDFISFGTEWSNASPARDVFADMLQRSIIESAESCSLLLFFNRILALLEAVTLFAKSHICGRL